MQSKICHLIISAMICVIIIPPTAIGAISYSTIENSAVSFYAVPPQSTAKCTVTKTQDSGSGTLRQCLLEATVGSVIDFDPAIFKPTMPISIPVSSPLPIITTDQIMIDGSNAGIIVDGSQLQRGDGLVIQGAQGVMIRGLAIQGFPQAGLVILGGAQNNVIGGSRITGAAPLGQGNTISHNGEGGLIIQDTGTTGNSVLGNDIVRNTGAGVRIRRLASQNTLGADNVISGNGGAGVWISDANAADPAQSTSENKVIGNHIGLDATGAISVTFGNDGTGVLVSDGAQKNIIGGLTPADRNVISNNAFAGVAIVDENSDQNQVVNNLIGTDVTGEKAFGNATGVLIRSGAKQNVIGGASGNERNIVSGNATGVFIWDVGTNQNKVVGNFIGTNISGTKAISNGDDGVNIGNGAQNNIIGGATPSERNIISGNGDDGFTIQDEGTEGNRIIGNFIGTDVTGSVAISNTNNGILVINGPSRTVIGGEIAGSGNVISGNGYQGILIRDPGTTETKVIGNIIGLDATGMNKLGNHNNGIFIIAGANNNFVGGETQSARNIIANNGFNGISIINTGTSNNRIQGNFIGIDVNGERVQGNTTNGILIGAGASGNIVGGEATNQRNIISGNGDNGIIIQNAETMRNQIIGNYIGTNPVGADITGDKLLGNKKVGILLVDGPKETEIKRNLISGNHFEGIVLRDVGTSNNRILGNFIGTDASGKRALGNVWSGIALILSTNNNTIGGEGVGEGNVISGNGGPDANSTGSGILLIEANANTILGNYIGTDVAGLNPLGNKHDGITIFDQSSDNIIGDVNAGNVIGSNGDSGVWLKGAGAQGNMVSGNHIGTDVNGAEQLPNTRYGIYLGVGAISNTVGVSNTIVNNIVAGVAISGTTTSGNKISRNSIHDNLGGQIVWFTPNGVNESLRLTDYSFAHLLSGEACLMCTVEVYANPVDSAAGALYLGSTTANTRGEFMLEVEPPPAFTYLSALQIMPDGTTSQFANGLEILPGFSYYLPLIPKDGVMIIQQTVANTKRDVLPTAPNQNKRSVSTKSSGQERLSGGEKQNAYASQP